MTDNNCCKCTTPQYTLILNSQGPQGVTGKNGQDGISPTIDVVTNTASQYILSITDINGTKRTPNLKGGIPSGGLTGQVLTKYSNNDREANWQNLPQGTTTTSGVFFANQLTDFSDPDIDDEGVVTYTSNTAITPAGLVELLGDIPTTMDNLFNGTGQLCKTDNTNGSLTLPWMGAENYFQSPSYNVINNTEQGFAGLYYKGGQYDIAIGAGVLGGNLYLDGTNIYKGTDTTVKIIDSTDIATTASAGIVKPDGTTITVDADGTIHGASTYNLPIASADTLGGIKIGNGLSITDDGTLSATGGSSNLKNIQDITNGVQIMGFEDVPSTGNYTKRYFEFTVSNTEGSPTLSAKAIILTYQNGRPTGMQTRNLLTDYSVTAGEGITVTRKNSGVEIGSATGNLKYWTGTSTEYEAITTPNADTMYRLTDTNKVYLGSIELTGGGASGLTPIVAAGLGLGAEDTGYVGTTTVTVTNPNEEVV